MMSDNTGGPKSRGANGRGVGDESAAETQPVPDGTPPSDTLGPHERLWADPERWGGEAQVPEHDYGPPIPSRFPDPRAVTSEIRELERRVRSLLPPVFTPERQATLPAPLRSLWRGYRQLAMRNRSAAVDDMGRDPVYAARYAPVLDFLYGRYFRTECRGLEHVPDKGRAILVANHGGALPYDALMLIRALETSHPARRTLRPLIEDDLFYFPFLGTFLNRMGAVRANPQNAARLLEDDQLVCVFPEGVKGSGKHYRERYQLKRFGRGGFVKLALRTGAPIIPVAVVGGEEATPVVGRARWLARAVGVSHMSLTPGVIPLPSKWILSFGPAIDLAAEHGPQAAEDRLEVSTLAEQVKTQLQGMIDEILTSRSSALRG